VPPAPHPDREQGVFETLLVVGGRPVELDAHLERLSGSLRALYDSALPANARQLALDRSGGIRLGRLRLTATQREGKLRLEAATAEVDPALVFPDPDRSVELRSLAIEGGLGAHKWVDRRPLERAEAGASGAVPLVTDRDGTVLEASRANVFAVRGGVLLTPPTDGRIIAGITRRAVIEIARAAGRELREGRLSVADLQGAEEVFLTNSVRGMEAVRSVDGGDLGRERAVTAEIAADLRRRWLGRGAPAAAAAAAP
jgi:para-aminobenzoate synthetase/4-amino-4-deoxychorismate lyase